MPESWNRAIVVAAHPDDIEYSLASAVARWTGEGKHISYLLATQGEAGIAGVQPELAGPLRMEEERSSARIVGVTEVEFLGHIDGLVEYGIRLRRDLTAAFRRARPQVVITTNFYLSRRDDCSVNQADHRAVGLAVLDACRDAANEWVFPEAGPRWGNIRDVYVSPGAEPAYFVDVTASIQAGIASLRQHQVYISGLGGNFDPDSYLKEMARSVGIEAGCEYAVAFQRYSMN
jgi:LmbE family N-acetylglucosaminyl deacetylase